VEVSYTKQAAMGQYATPGSAPYLSASGVSNPVANELDWQTQQALVQIARDVNYSLINGIQNIPTTNAAARKTKGLIQACATNKVNKGTALADCSVSTDTITVTHALNNGDKVIFTDTGGLDTVVAGRVYYVVSRSTTVSFKVAETSGGSAITLGTATVQMLVPSGSAHTLTDIEDLIQGVYDNGGLASGLGTLLCNSTQKRTLSALYGAAYAKAVPVRGNIGGVNVEQIETDFGILNVMLDRSVPQDALIVCSMDQLSPVFLNIPNKGVFFEEPLAKTGATDAVQIYGEIGLKYGNERAHGVLRGLKV
jgi:co-chaperonin GroES (HSP10)